MKDELKELVKEFPKTPGVYLMKNDKDKVIYVGKAKNLRARVRSYFNNLADHSLKTKYLVNQIANIQYLLTKTEVEAFLLEASLIKKYRPRYNIRLKDDKTYPYIRCSLSDEFPRFYLVRRVKQDGSVYFGPYTSGWAVRGTIRFLNRTFKIRDCNDVFMKSRKRPCMTYQIGRCTAPCVDYVNKEEYGKDIKAALTFLKGKEKQVVKDLTEQMKSAANEERFEVAAKIRDSIEVLKRILEKQTVVNPNAEKDQDVVAYYGDERGVLIETLHIRSGRVIGNRPHFISKLDPDSDSEEVKDWLTSFLNQYYEDNMIPDEIILPVDLGGDIIHLLKAVFNERQGKEPKINMATGELGKKLLDMAYANAKSHFQDQVSKHENRLKGLDEIQQKLHLPEIPLRIECFDISNFQGSQSVASQVVFEEGLPKKEDYRRYKIKTVEGPNDFASMKEVLERRFKHTEYDDPQLVVIDGGKGQLKMAIEVLKELGRTEIPVVGLAKARTQGSFQEQDVKQSKERFFLPGRQNPVTFANNSEALAILVGIRDEAHRFAITFHRKLRDDVSLASVLDDITGLGEKRKQRLLKKFESVEGIRSASVEEIASLPTFNRVLAERILLHLDEST
ncbi:MAG: excinuclease ABC subunit UvrC [Bdellovibrionales bacterium]|nr:excinuclease ABC subunit UvrC [Bdellovibrionales bacterium]